MVVDAEAIEAVLAAVVSVVDSVEVSAVDSEVAQEADSVEHHAVVPGVKAVARDVAWRTGAAAGTEEGARRGQVCLSCLIQEGGSGKKDWFAKGELPL